MLLGHKELPLLIPGPARVSPPPPGPGITTPPPDSPDDHTLPPHFPQRSNHMPLLSSSAAA